MHISIKTSLCTNVTCLEKNDCTGNQCDKASET